MEWNGKGTSMPGRSGSYKVLVWLRNSWSGMERTQAFLADMAHKVVLVWLRNSWNGMERTQAFLVDMAHKAHIWTSSNGVPATSQEFLPACVRMPDPSLQ
eukprot:1151391-Pelagomonas_calceolata.AAC.4